MTIVVFGANGLMGQEFRNLKIHDNIYFASKSQCDITNIYQIRDYIKTLKLDENVFFINCAANRDAEQMELNGIEKSRDISICGPHNLAIVANEFSATLIHFSSDYVFDGKKSLPYNEKDKVSPLSVYGKLKVLSEQDLMNTSRSLIIIRPAWIFSEYGKDFIKTIYNLGKTKSELKVIFDQVGSPTYGTDLAKYIYQILPQVKYGVKEIYHLTNEGVCSWYDIACSVKRHMGLKCNIIPVHSNEYTQNAPRPSFSVLDKTKIKKDFNLNIRHYEDALAECCKKIREKQC